LAISILLLVFFASQANGQWAAAWGGANTSGECNVPPDLDQVVSVSGGYSFSLALKADGTVVQWGTLAAQPAGLNGVVAIAGGQFHALALKSDGSVVAWGDNSNNQCSVPAGLGGVVAIAAGGPFSLALKSDGTLAYWGTAGSSFQLPAGLNHVTAIAASNSHALALKDDGTVVGWGSDFDHDVAPPAGLTGVVAIAAQPDHSLALKGDGTVVTWGGMSSTPSLAIPSGLSGVAKIGGTLHYSVAIKTDGTVVGWGDTSTGLGNYPTKAIGLGGGTTHLLAVVDGFVVSADSYKVAGGSATQFFGNLKLSTAQATDTVVQLSSSNSSLASVPSSVTIPAGQTEFSFEIIHNLTNSRKTIVITATGLGGTARTSFFVDPIYLTKLNLDLNINGGDTKIARVYVDYAPRDPMVLHLSSSNTSLATVPATVTLPSSASSVTFLVSTFDVATTQYVEIKATKGSQLVAKQVNINPGPQRVVALAMNPNPVEGGKACLGTVTLVRAATSNVSVDLSSSDNALASVPSTVTVLAGNATATFSVGTPVVRTNTFAQISASLGSTGTKTTKLTINRQPPVKSLSIPAMFGNQEVTGSVTLSSPATVGGTSVSLSTNVAGLSIPASVTIPEGQTSITFPVDSDDVAVRVTVMVSASDGSNSMSRSVLVKPNVPTSVALTQTALSSGQSCTATVTLSGIVRSDTSVEVAIGGADALEAPTTVVVPAGAKTVDFTVTAKSVTHVVNSYVRVTRWSHTVSGTVKVSP
jgi:hypothetical protein